MSGFLIDTNVISETIKPKPEPRVLDWLNSAEESLLYLSVLTLGEIRYGASMIGNGRRRAAIEAWLESALQKRFAGRILPLDAVVAERWGRLRASAARRGKPIPVIDSLLAATALQYDLTLVTRNSGDFRGSEVPLLNPWEE
jgi:predicted nucleic acid-binding protein